jgi:hypothetical protein
VFTKKHQVFEPLPGAQVHSIALKLRAWPADTQRSAFQWGGERKTTMLMMIVVIDNDIVIIISIIIVIIAIVSIIVRDIYYC